MTLKRRIDKLEDKSPEQHPPVMLWHDVPLPTDLKPGQEVIRLRWKEPKEAYHDANPS